MRKIVLLVAIVAFASAATITVQLNSTKPSGLNWDGPGSGVQIFMLRLMV